MKTGIIYSVGLYQRGVVIRGGRKIEVTRKRLRPVGGGRNASPSYDPPKDYNISSSACIRIFFVSQTFRVSVCSDSLL